MNSYFYYIVPGVLAFFVVWVFFRFLVKRDLGRQHAFLYLAVSIVLIGLLVLGYYKAMTR